MNWKRTICLVTAALLLSGCGGAKQTPEQKEDAEIRAAMGDEAFGHGGKMALYDPDTKLYSYHGQPLPEIARAEKPEEIGTFVYYRADQVDKDGNPRFFRLWFAFDTSVVFDLWVSDGFLMISGPDDGDLRPDFNTPTVKDPGEVWSVLRRWISEVRPKLAYITKVSRRGPSPTGGGEKLIGRDRDTGKYSIKYISRSMTARSDEELGFILSYSLRMVPAEGDYIKHGRIRGLSEKMEWELLDAVTGEVVDSGEIGGQAPGVLVFYTGDPEAGFTEYLTIESVDAQMSSAWERMGRRWIWDSHNPYSTD